MELFSFTLPNGIRLVHHPTGRQVAHCGVFINAGSRDELDREHGIAHFIEHTIFKGTQKRNVTRVLNRLEHVGADLNAYTSKEETCIHASFLSEYYDRTLELFQDIFFHSTFPEAELEREKMVVMDEIKSFLDTPAEQIFDDFEDHLFHGHPLGRNILGTPASIRKLTRQDVLDFIHRNYRLEDVVIASVGNISFHKLKKLVGRYFDLQHMRGPAQARLPFLDYKPFRIKEKRKTAQVHCLIGTPAYAYGDDKRVPLALLNNMLGGPVMNSRLSLALRERNGLAYHSESNYTAYSDTGVMNIYFGSDASHHQQARELVIHELGRLKSEKLTPIQLHTVKKQISGQLAIGQESNLSMMLAMGKSFLLKDRFDPVELILKQIQDVRASDLIDIANEIFDEGRLSQLIFER